MMILYSFCFSIVALLTPKGKCSTKTKAKVASALLPKGTVHHLIVYGYDIDDGSSSNSNDDDDDDGFPRNIAHKSLTTHLLKSNQISLIDEDDDNDNQSSNEDINVSIVYISAVDGIGKLFIPPDINRFSHEKYLDLPLCTSLFIILIYIFGDRIDFHPKQAT